MPRSILLVVLVALSSGCLARAQVPDRRQLPEGQVRHPVTGQPIAAEDLPRAEDGLFPLPDGRWVDASTADSHHAELATPWRWRTDYATVLTTLPVATRDELVRLVDGSIDLLRPLLGDEAVVESKQRPLLFVCATTDQYRNLGNAIGSERSVYGAFLADEPPVTEDEPTEGTPAVANWGAPQGWGQYYVRHAAGLAALHAATADSKQGLPYWFVCGVGSFAERHYTPGISKFFGEQHAAKGGIGDLREWFADFEISPQQPVSKVEYNVYQAGLMLAFAQRGGDRLATKALEAVRKELAGSGRGLARAVQRLEKILVSRQEAAEGYFRELLQE